MELNKLRELRKELFTSKTIPHDISANDFADYPWDQCIADQTKAYGSKAIAEAVCGKIKAENSSKQEMDITPNPCEPGYEPIGLKDDGSPNCVPKKKKMGSEEFKIPTPNAGEKPDAYVSRCMKAIGSEYDSQEQALAVCYAQIEKK
jgi:hypothetical protein